jgi:hypothetical protein
MWQFLWGFLTCLTLFSVHYGVRIFVDLRAARRAKRALANLLVTEDDRDRLAWEKVKACKSRLRWRREVNPDWITPLTREVPELVREVAAAYYPDSANPLLAPGLNQFARAVKLAAEDVIEILESRYLGWLVNTSADTAVKRYNLSRRVTGHSAFKWLTRWTRRLTPVMQAVRYNSPLMWGSLVANNLAFRLVQPAIVDLIARRVVELYSGRVLDDSAKQAAVEALREAEAEFEAADEEAVRESG